MSKRAEAEMKKGDTLYYNGKPCTIVWSSDEMTDAERYESHMQTAEFLESYGVSGAFQRAMAERYRDSGSGPTGRDVKQTRGEAPQSGDRKLAHRPTLMPVSHPKRGCGRRS
jgi:hypothetical protein